LGVKRIIIILSDGIKYSMHDLFRDVINYCASSFAGGILNVYDQIVVNNLNSRRNGYE